MTRTPCLFASRPRAPARIAAAAAALLVCTLAAAASAQQSYKTPDEAVSALVTAAKAGDRKAVLTVLGPGGEDIVSSGDEVADQEVRKEFIAAYDEKHAIHVVIETPRGSRNKASFDEELGFYRLNKVLPEGMTFEKLASMSSDEIRDQGVFPKGYLPLPHPKHEVGGMVFPQMEIKQLPRLQRFDGNVKKTIAASEVSITATGNHTSERPGERDRSADNRENAAPRRGLESA